MRLSPIIFAALIAATASAQQFSTAVRYDSGSLPVAANAKLSLTVTSATITLMHGTRGLSIPVGTTNAIFYGSKVRERTKKSVIIGGLAGAALFGKSKTRYIGISWTDSTTNKEGGAVLKFDGEKAYRQALEALTAATGKHPVNTDTASGGQ